MKKTEKFRIYATEINSILDHIDRAAFDADERIYNGEIASILVIALAQRIVKLSEPGDDAHQISENFSHLIWQSVDAMVRAKRQISDKKLGVTKR